MLVWGNTRILGNTFFTLLSVVIPGLLGLWSLKPLFQLLGSANFTLLSFFWVYTAHLGFFDFGMARLMGIEIPKSKEAEKSIIIYGGLKKALVFAAMGIAIVVILLTIGSIWVYEYKYLYKLPVVIALLAWVPLAVITLVLRAILEATDCFKAAALFRAYNQSALFITPWVMALLGNYTPFELVAAITGFRILSLLIALIWLQNQHGPPTRGWTGVSVIGKQNIWLTLSNGSGIINGSLDRFMLLTFFGAQAIGSYVFAQDFSVRILVLSSSFALVLLPFFAKNGNKLCNDKWIFRSSFLVIITHAGIGIIVLVAGPLILKNLYNPEWSRWALRFFLIFLVGITANGIGHILLSALHSQREFKKPALWHFVSAGLYIPFLYLVIQIFGLYGAAIMMSVRSIIDTGVLFYLWKQCK